MKRFCTISAFLLATLPGAAQVVDSIPQNHFETESDSILYELSLSEGAEDVYDIYDTTTYEDYDGAIIDYFCYPDYEGGPDSVKAFIERNLQRPPGYEETSGKVLVEAIIETDGTLTNPKVKVSLDPVLDAEAVRVVISLPNKWIWDPSRCYKGEIYRCFFMFVVSFE